MGCWDETCGLTWQPIFDGQRCVAIRLKSGFLASAEWTYFYTSGEMPWSEYVRVDRGVYDGYGRLKGDAGDPSPDTVFFHEDAWDACVKHQRRVLSAEGIADVTRAGLISHIGSRRGVREEPDESFVETALVVLSAQQTRRPFLGATAYRGSQDRFASLREKLLQIARQHNDRLLEKAE